LFIDKCLGHPKNIDHLSNIGVEFLPPSPPNNTSVVQLMDQGTIKTLKVVCI